MEVNGRFYVSFGKLVVCVPKLTITGAGNTPFNELELKKLVEREARARIAEVMGPVETTDDCEFLDSKPKGEATHGDNTIKIWKI